MKSKTAGKKRSDNWGRGKKWDSTSIKSSLHCTMYVKEMARQSKKILKDKYFLN